MNRDRSLRGFRKDTKEKNQASILRFIRHSGAAVKCSVSSSPESATNGIDSSPNDSEYTKKSEVNFIVMGSTSTSPNRLECEPPPHSKLLFMKPLTDQEEKSAAFSTDPEQEGFNINAVLKNSPKIKIENSSTSVQLNTSCQSMSSVEEIVLVPYMKKRRMITDSDEDEAPPAKRLLVKEDTDESKNTNEVSEEIKPGKFSQDMIDKLIETYADLYPTIDKMEIFDVMRRWDYNFAEMTKELDQLTRITKQKQRSEERQTKLNELVEGKRNRTLSKGQARQKHIEDREYQRQLKVAEKNRKKQVWRIKGRNAHVYEEDEEEDYIKNTKVYESDSSEDGESDSGEEHPEVCSARTAVLNFVNEGTFTELIAIPGCSRKKTDIIMQARPFANWEDLVTKFKRGSYLSTDLLNSVKDLLVMRDGISKLMKKCEHIASDIHSAVSKIITGEQDEGINEQPKSLNENLLLKPYQLIGLNWLVLMYQQGLNGVLADEMGLGKTIQSIAFLAYLKEQEELDRLCLIVVPSSTIENWSKELSLWCPSLGFLFYHGSQEERRGMRADIYNDELDENVHIILTTYNMVTSSVEDRALFKRLPFHTVIFDEAHMLKNMSSLRYENLMKIKTKHRLLLTGTPLQNNLVELMSILIFVMPQLFEGRKEQLKKIFSMFPKSESGQIRGQYEKGRIEQAKRIMKPFFLRRLKVDVLKDLPTKEMKLMKVQMSSRQQTVYKQTVQALNRTVQQMKEELAEIKEEEVRALTELESLGDRKKSKQFSLPENSSTNILMTLRKLANHPLLIRNLYNDDKLKEMAQVLKKTTHRDSLLEYIFDDLSWMSDFEIHKTCFIYKPIQKYCLETKDILLSGKFKEFDNLLPAMKERGDRILIFSQFTIMLDIIEDYMKFHGHTYCRLDGSTQVTERQELIDGFNENDEIFIFLLSTRAGGLGINLSSANTVILHDIDFNPYNDRQAEDRCHRVGQTRVVTVHRFISKDTIEEGMYDIASQKLQLEKDVTGQEDSRKADVLSLLKTALATYSS